MAPGHIVVAHGVGRVYQSPLPLSLYLLGAGATVAMSFVLRAFVHGDTRRKTERRIAGETAALVVMRLLKAVALVGLIGTLVAGPRLGCGDRFDRGRSYPGCSGGSPPRCSHGAAVKSQYALTVLMSAFTITTLWLLSQPLLA